MTEPNILESWYERAAANPQRIMLADAGDERADAAAVRLNSSGLAHATVVSDPAAIFDQVDAALVTEVSEKSSRPFDLSDPLNAATMAVRAGIADACIAGASRPLSLIHI